MFKLFPRYSTTTSQLCAVCKFLSYNKNCA